MSNLAISVAMKSVLAIGWTGFCLLLIALSFWAGILWIVRPNYQSEALTRINGNQMNNVGNSLKCSYESDTAYWDMSGGITRGELIALLEHWAYSSQPSSESHSL